MAAPRAPWSDERSGAAIGGPWVMTVVISIATFMEILDVSIANVSLHNIAGSLGVSPNEITWIVTSYLVANAIVIPISGYLSNVIGRKRYFMMSIALFTSASLLSALSPNLTMLIFARVLQGIGGGGLAPVEQSLLADSFPPEKRGRAFAAFGIVVVVAPILGPTLGGFITDSLSWHWVFLINIPIGIIALFLVSIVVREAPMLVAEREQRLRNGLQVDWIGFLLTAVGLACLLVTLDRGETLDWFASPFIRMSAAIALMSLIAAIIWEWRCPDPIVPIRMLAENNFRSAALMMFTLGLMIFGVIQIIPQMLQTVFYYTPFWAGLALTIGGIATIIAMPISGIVVSKVDPRALLVPAFLMQAAGFWFYSGFSLEADFGHAAFGRFLMSVGLPFIFIPINMIAYLGIDPRETSKASAMLNFFRNLGGAFGISIIQTTLLRRGQFHQARLTEGLSEYNHVFMDAIQNLQAALGSHGAALAEIYRQVQRQASILAYTELFSVLSIAILIVVPFIFFLRTPDMAPAPQGGPAAQPPEAQAL